MDNSGKNFFHFDFSASEYIMSVLVQLSHAVSCKHKIIMDDEINKKLKYKSLFLLFYQYDLNLSALWQPGKWAQKCLSESS